MKFQVPQFIEMENTIFGPLTFKEFSYLAGGAGLSFLIYRFTPTMVAFILIIPVIAFAVALAFYRPNNKPFIEMIQSAIVFAFGNKLYIWKKEKPLIVTGKKEGEEENKENDLGPMIVLTHTGKSKLTDMAFNLDTKPKNPEEGRKNDGLNLQI
jgi:hypothetical protein